MGRGSRATEEDGNNARWSRLRSRSSWQVALTLQASVEDHINAVRREKRVKHGTRPEGKRVRIHFFVVFHAITRHGRRHGRQRSRRVLKDEQTKTQ
jgi:hypothetical protein